VATTTTVAMPTFAFAAVPIEGAVRSKVEGSSWRPGCPVPLEQLRYVTLSHWGFDGTVHSGELIVNADAVAAIDGAFRRLFADHFPIRTMRLVDDYGADDFTSIEADNTSAFNCRERSTGGGVWSQHAYGRAIDVNPIENPYVTDGTTSHAASGTYLARSNVRPGMAVTNGSLVAAFAAVGWGWGGTWSSPTDYQHFSSTGG
jgi:poly-gamma-glutamate synthesis protein (capsule biosynthesis protein)